MARVITEKLSGPMQPSEYTLRVHRVGMCGYAREFFEIAKKTRVSPVKYYLLGHALELYLKSFLMKQGVPLSTLKKKPYSHNISRLLAEAKAKGIERHFRISPELVTDIDEFSSFYAAKGYEYFPIVVWMFRRHVPKADRVSAFATRLHMRLPEIIQED